MATSKRNKSAIEALMYIWGEPLEIKDAAEACGISNQEAKECFLELQAEYDQEGRGLMIRQVGNGFQYATRPEYAEQVEKLCTPVRTRKLSQAALEVLAIVAYKQPVTKSEIDSIRGIKCDRVMEGLMKKELVQELGRSAGIGRPILYGTTDTFLKLFGFKTLKELPEIEDIEEVLAMDHNDEDLPPELQVSLEEISADSEAPEIALAEEATTEDVAAGDVAAGDIAAEDGNSDSPQE